MMSQGMGMEGGGAFEELERSVEGFKLALKDAEKEGQQLGFNQLVMDKQLIASKNKIEKAENVLGNTRKKLRDPKLQSVGEIDTNKENIAQNIEASKQLKIQAGYWAHLKDTGHELAGIFGKWEERIAAFVKKVKETPLQFMLMDLAWLGLVALLGAGIERFKRLDKAAEEFRKETGFTITQMAQVREDAQAINLQFAYMGIGIEQAYKSAKALTDVFGRTSLLTKDAMQNVALLSVNLGVSEEDSANVLANFQGLGGVTQQAAMNVIKVGAGISEKAGVPFSMVMKDIANASAETTFLLGSNPSKLMKSAIAARALGLDINKIASSQKKLLDYSTSINDELSASALLGESISFQKARQLAYDGKIDEAAKATLETVKEAGDWNEMTVYQRQALAEASGMDVKDITKALAVEKQRSDIMNGQDEAKKKILLSQEKALDDLKKQANLDDDDLVKQNEKILLQQKMQGLMTKLQNISEQLAATFGDILEPFITPLTNFVLPAMQKISAWIGSLSRTKQRIVGGGILTVLLLGVGGLPMLLKSLTLPFTLVKNLASTAVSKIPGVGGVMGKLLGSSGDAAKKASKSGGFLKSIGTSIKDFAKEIGKISWSSIAKAAVIMVVLAGGLVAMAFALKQFKGIDWKEMAMAGVSLAGLMGAVWLISKMDTSTVIKGAIAIALIGASLIPFAFSMKMLSAVDWSQIGKAGIALAVLTAATFALGALLMTGVGAAVFVLGVAGIAALGLALIPFGVAAIAAGYGMKLLGEGIKSGIDPLIKFANVAPKLVIATTAIGALSIALAAFAGASVIGKITSFFTGDPFAKFKKLADMGDQLKKAADAMAELSEAGSTFGAMNSFAVAVGKLADSIGRLNKQLGSMSTENLNVLSALSVGAGTTATSPTSSPTMAVAKSDNTGVESRLDKLIGLLENGAIGINMDGKKLSSAMSSISA
jgi:hypothetical protein